MAFLNIKNNKTCTESFLRKNGCVRCCYECREEMRRECEFRCENITENCDNVNTYKNSTSADSILVSALRNMDINKREEE